MEKKYTHQRMIRDFSLNEIASGLEEALAEPRAFTRCQIDEANVKLKAHYFTGRQRRSTVTTEVLIDEDKGELVETSCECAAFMDSLFSCSHICTLLGHYILEQEEKENLLQTDLLEKVKEDTRVEDPFRPGVLRKTDTALSSFLAGITKSSPAEKPQWVLEQEKKVNPDPISVEVSAGCVSNTFQLEIKAGPKRHYVIRDLMELTRAYRKNGSYPFTASLKCPAGRSRYTESDRRLMDCLAKLCEMNEREVLGYSLFSYRGGTDVSRSMEPLGRDLDMLMEALDGRTISLSGESLQAPVKCRVKLDAESAPIKLSKTEYGAVLEGGQQEVLVCGMDWMYVRQENVILRLPAEQWEQRRALSKALKEQEELYIQDQDLPAVCEGLLALGMEDTSLQVQGMELTQYVPEEPQIRIYLDYPQEGLVNSEVKAYYPVKQDSYNVCDQHKDRKKRNIPFEQAAGEAIWSCFSAYDEANKQMCLEVKNEAELFQFLTETIPALSEYGEVFVSENIRRLKVRPAGEVSVGLQVDAGNLVMSLNSNEMTKDEMIEVLSSYRCRRRFTRLKSGEFVVFSDADMELWNTISETYREYGRKNPEAMKLPLFRALYLQECLTDRENLQLEEGDKYLSLVADLKNEDMPADPVPESLKDILREYQADGYRWMRMLKRNGFGGILADDMGLGKTLQVLAFLLAEKSEEAPENAMSGHNKSSLIVAPASLVYNWKKEAERFTPELRCRVISGTAAQRKAIIEAISDGEADLYVTSYDLLKRDIHLYEGIHFENEFIDEAQYIKNQNTQVSKAVRLAESTFRMALTGTPIENRLSELWSIFDYLMPGFLYGYSRFREEFEAPVINDHDEVVLKRLRSLVHPFILRRLKKEVLKDLPDKSEETITVSLEGGQRQLYDAYAERLRLSLDRQSDEEFHQKKLEILAELTRLRQICCGPESFLEDYKGENAKKDACLELVRQAIDAEHKILIFSQFTSVLDCLGEALTAEGLDYHRIDGSVSKEKRMEMVESFAVDTVPLFLISLKAGGTGLNLTAADIVIHYDPWWNIAAQNQATDRTHRIGQENHVTVYQLIAEKTVEEQIAKLQQTKARLAEDILSGEGIASIMINKEELMGLL